MFKDILDNNNMTIAECSRRSGVAKSTITDLVKGKTSIDKMSALNLYKLSECFGVRMDALYHYCRLPEITDYEAFCNEENNKVAKDGFKPYMADMEKTYLIETCYKLNDTARLKKYYELMMNFYTYRLLEVPEKYKQIPKPE